MWWEFETKMNMAQTNLSRRDSLKIARRFNAGIGLDGASSPGAADKFEVGSTRALACAGGRPVRQPDGVAGRMIRFVHAHRECPPRGASDSARGGRGPR